ncbi:MAG: T9SS type A sorting domain-containing protein [Bacteroidia bacterium]
MRFSLIVLLFGLALGTKAQGTSICKDSLQTPNPYYPCANDYMPVCGCDNVTYRNECAAYYWGGLLYSYWTQGPCEPFDFDFYPTYVYLNPVHFSLYMKQPGSATLYIYNAMGNLVYSDYFYAPYADYTYTKELPLQSLQQGVYLAMVLVNGQKKTLRFGKQGQ